VEKLEVRLLESEQAHDYAARWFQEQKKQFDRAEQAEREAAFWKWLWNHANPLTTAQGEKSESQWLAHMRERWEREAS
jgi:hypothetical protein